MRMVWSWRIRGWGGVGDRSSWAVCLGPPMVNGHEHDLSEQCFPENGHGHALPNAHGHKMVMGMPSRMPHGQEMVMGMKTRMPHGQKMVMGMKTRMPMVRKWSWAFLAECTWLKNGRQMVDKLSKKCQNMVCP